MTASPHPQPLSFTIERILVDPSVEGHPQTVAMLERLQEFGVAASPEMVSAKELSSVHRDMKWEADEIGAGKRVLYLTQGQGRHIVACPGTTKSLCCNYYIIELVENCPYDCSYCFLQSYLTSPLLRVNVNIEDYLAQIDERLRAEPQRHFRVGSGELSDSLALEPITKHGAQLVEFFSQRSNATLELKTKTARVDSLLDLDHRQRTVVGWSLNPESIVTVDERGTASTEQRIRAAEKVVNAGYKVGFHFDPVVLMPGWNLHYFDLIDRLAQRIDGSSVVWVSLGALRFPKGLRSTMMNRFPESKLPHGEFVEGVDKKGRYPFALRTSAYGRLQKWIRKRWPRAALFMCMENRAIWDNVTGGKPHLDPRLEGIYG